MSLEFVSERACAPPALSALNLGRLQRVVLPVKRDRSPDNPNGPCDYSSCVPESRKRTPDAGWEKGLAQGAVPLAGFLI